MERTMYPFAYLLVPEVFLSPGVPNRVAVERVRRTGHLTVEPSVRGTSAMVDSLWSPPM